MDVIIHHADPKLMKPFNFWKIVNCIITYYEWNFLIEHHSKSQLSIMVHTVEGTQFPNFLDKGEIDPKISPKIGKVSIAKRTVLYTISS